jgi:formamidopyrimidine-DNA glycosylase
MPELPEVEITRRGLLPLLNQTVKSVVIRNASMRWPIPAHLPQTLHNQQLVGLTRRAKYILAGFLDVTNAANSGTLLLHLGMSGRISLLDRSYPPEKHDHFDIAFADGRVLRLRDPRRFGAVLWAGLEPNKHALLAPLGPEPLDDVFNAKYLQAQLKTRSAAIKVAIMDSHLVVGVGNIYASESLFRARIHPETPAKNLTLKQCEKLVAEIKATLNAALDAGGSSLRDFFGVDGNIGYFQQEYYVYGRTNEPCKVCSKPIKCIRLGQRSTFFCPNCQKLATPKALAKNDQ